MKNGLNLQSQIGLITSYIQNIKGKIMTESILLTIVTVVCLITSIVFYQYFKDREDENNKIQFK